MTSTMSLAARICSRVAGERKPAMLGSERDCAVHFSGDSTGFGRRLVGDDRHAVDQYHPKIIRDERADEGFLEHSFLHLLEGGEKIAGETLLPAAKSLKGRILLCLNFRSRVVGRIHQGHAEKEDAQITDQAGKYAEIIFGPAKKTAAFESDFQKPFHRDEHREHEKGQRQIAKGVASRPAKASKVVENLPGKFISQTSGQNDGNPTERRDQFLCQSILAPTIRAKGQQGRKHDVKPAKRQFVECQGFRCRSNHKFKIKAITHEY